jgi:hypothetical protein
MKYTGLALFFVFNGFFLTGFSQAPNWLNFTIPDNLRSFAVDSSDIWVCSQGGWVMDIPVILCQ